MGWCLNHNGDELAWEDPAAPEVDITDNPIIAELLDLDGNIVKQWTARPPIGFR